MVDKNIGRRIKMYREARKMSQEVLAERIGLSKTAMSCIERGVSYPSLDNFIKVCNALGVSSDAILADVVDGAVIKRENELKEFIDAQDPIKRRKICDLLEMIIKAGL